MRFSDELIDLIEEKIASGGSPAKKNKKLRRGIACREYRRAIKHDYEPDN